MTVIHDNSRYPSILADDIEVDPILDFDRYSDAIVNIVKGTEPKFTIGIYGEWGTGKSTLMKSIEEKRHDYIILTVWFNAWRYEREEHFALIALIKTVAYAMEEHPIYKELKPILLKGLRIFGKDFLRQVASQFISEKGIENFEKSLLPKMELLSEMDKDTIYFDGINKIQNEMQKIIQKYPKSRVVVFIDDLDRCSPKTTVEVFESVKVFLGMEGFIYIIGLSHDTISKLISAQYKESGIKGDQYIKKIIQIPITIQEWNIDDVKLLVQNLVNKNILHTRHREILEKNINLIAKAVEHNPREVKRFINNFIVAHEMYSVDKNIKSEQLLVVQAIAIRWNNFYRIIINSAISHL